MDHRRPGTSDPLTQAGASHDHCAKKNARLLEEFEALIGSLEDVFGSPQSFQRARRHLLAQLVSFGRHTISSLLRAQNRHQQDWSADYRFYSLDRFDEQAVFNQIRHHVEESLPPQSPLVVAMDDSLLRKTGRKMAGANYQRDPMSPPFHVNFVRGLRVLQISAALPQGPGQARLVPVDFEQAALPPKPSRKAGPQEWQRYREHRAQRNINCIGAARLSALRQQMDRQGNPRRQLVVAVDGRFTNRTLLSQLPARTLIIGRLRKDAVLHELPQVQPDRGRRRKYGARTLTPEELLADAQRPFQKVRAFAAGQFHQFSLKHLGPVLLRLDRATQPVQIVVIKPLGYRLKKGGKLLYRQPAFLVCTDPHLPLAELLQDFLWRWDIEVNFRDEKTLLGVGQAQVRTPASNQNAPALAVAAYSLLLLASAKAYGSEGAPERLTQAKWYRRQPSQRATTNELINQLRRELWSEALNSTHLGNFTSTAPMDQKSQKCPVPFHSAAFLSLN